MSINGDGMLFSAPMVRALWDGRKTQTRRPLYSIHKIKNGKVPNAMFDRRYPPPMTGPNEYPDLRHVLLVGGKIWVRETWKPIPESKPGGYFVEGSPFYGREVFYHADHNCPLWADGPWKPSIHLARKHSRLTLTVTDVRIERLQAISNDDAIAEGVEAKEFTLDGETAMHYRGHEGAPWRHYAWGGATAYLDLWERINGEGSWAENPWVVAYTFSVERKNIDA